MFVDNELLKTVYIIETESRYLSFAALYKEEMTEKKRTTSTEEIFLLF